MYMLAFGVFWLLAYYRIRKGQLAWDVTTLNDLCFYAAIGAVLGGRCGYVLFYTFEHFLADPLWLFRIWEGGMSFHGGLLGVIAAILIWSWRTSQAFWVTMDAIAPMVPAGLGIGRIGNFINTELPGRVTDFSLGVYFPCESVLEHNYLCFGSFENVTRHLSSIYQFIAEGIILFLLLWIYSSKPHQTGRVAAAFLLGYAVFRFVTEFFRQPDADLGFILFGWITMGQLLSLFMAIGGFTLLLPQVSSRLNKSVAP